MEWCYVATDDRSTYIRSHVMGSKITIFSLTRSQTNLLANAAAMRIIIQLYKKFNDATVADYITIRIGIQF